MRTDIVLAAAATIAAFAVASGTAAQETRATPVLDHTVPLSRTFGIEMIAIDLRLAEVFTPPFDAEFVELLEDMGEAHWLRFAGTLAAADRALAGELKGLIEEIAERAENGEPLGDMVVAALPRVESARSVVLAPAPGEDPAFVGALIVDLLLAEGGVAEAYEEAAEGEVWKYSVGWAALARIEALWPAIAPLADETLRTDAEEMFAALRTLFPDPGPPASVVGWNPEEAEPHAQRLAGIVEQVVGADLFAGRDLARLTEHLGTTVGEACSLHRSGADDLAAEHVAAAFDRYHADLAGTVALFAPEAGERVISAFAALVPAIARADVYKDADDEPTMDGDSNPVARAETCDALGADLTALAGLFGG